LNYFTTVYFGTDMFIAAHTYSKDISYEPAHQQNTSHQPSQYVVYELRNSVRL